MTYLVTIDYGQRAESRWITVPNLSDVKALLQSIKTAINAVLIYQPWKEIRGEAIEDEAAIASFRVREGDDGR